MQNSRIIKPDWLNTKPIFFNEKLKKYSGDILDVIDFENFNWNFDGLKNYLDFGYCVFGTTPYRDVNFLLPDDELHIDENGSFKIVQNQSITEKLFSSLENISTPNKCFELLESSISNFGKKNENLVLPLSGGLDSRIILYFLPKTSGLQTFTYGISPNQSQSHEVVMAKYLSEKLHLNWHQIELRSMNQYISTFYEIFGPSIHCHGMYHCEFYNKINDMGFRNMPLLTGIIGDAWAGSIQPKTVASPDELANLALNHGMKADSSKIRKFHSTDSAKEKFWFRNKPYIHNPKWRLILMMQIKMMLLRYLMETPRHYSFDPYGPFLEKELALEMLCLPDTERSDRKWQRDFLNKYLSIPKLKMTYANNLNTQGLLYFQPETLNVELLRELFDESYILWINNNMLNNFSSKYKYYLNHWMSSSPIKINSFFPDSHLAAYFAYLTILPLQKVIEQRIQH